jgi:hypothetical protein
MGLHNAKSQSICSESNIKANVEGNLNVLCVQMSTTRDSIVITIRSAPIVVNLTWLYQKIVNISLKKKKLRK